MPCIVGTEIGRRRHWDAQVVFYVGDGIGVLVPCFAGGRPRVVGIAIDTHRRCVAIMADHNLGVSICIYIGDDWVVKHGR